MAMVSMKTDEAMSDYGCCPCPPPSPYGYGLCIHLNDDQCEALGFKAPLAAGSTVVVQALAVVVSATQSVEMDGDDKGPDVTMSLQITDMDVRPKGGRSSGEMASTLYQE